MLKKLDTKKVDMLKKQDKKKNKSVKSKLLTLLKVYLICVLCMAGIIFIRNRTTIIQVVRDRISYIFSY